jgi:ABC-type transporter Mla subunit MlaD
MAKKRTNEVAVGLTVLVTLLLTIFIVVKLGKWEDWLIPKQKITVLMPYEKGLKGLTEGSPVFLGGAKIGKIIEADIKDPNAKKEIFVFFTMEIPKKYEIYTNCKLMAQSNVLGGQASLAIEGLGSGETGGKLLNPGEKDNDTLFLEDMKGGVEEIVDSLRQQLDDKNPDSLMYKVNYQLSYKPDSLVTSLTEALKEYTEVADRINYQLDPNEQRALVAHVHKVIKNLKHTSRSLKQEMNKEDGNSLLARVHEVMGDIHGVSRELREQMDPNDDAKLLAKLCTTLDDLKETNRQIQSLLRSSDTSKPLSNVEEILANLDEAIRQINLLLKHQYPNIDLAIQNIVESSESLKKGLNDLENQPNKLLFSKPPTKSENEK